MIEPPKHVSSARFTVQPKGSYSPAQHGESRPYVYHRDMEIWGFEEDVRPLLQRMRIDRCLETGAEKLAVQHVDNGCWRRRGEIERFEDGTVHVSVRFSVAVDNPTAAKNHLVTNRVDCGISDYVNAFRNEGIATFQPSGQEIS